MTNNLIHKNQGGEEGIIITTPSIKILPYDNKCLNPRNAAVDNTKPPCCSPRETSSRGNVDQCPVGYILCFVFAHTLPSCYIEAMCCHEEHVKVVVAYWKVKTPCHAHGECIN